MPQETPPLFPGMPLVWAGEGDPDLLQAEGADVIDCANSRTSDESSAPERFTAVLSSCPSIEPLANNPPIP